MIIGVVGLYASGRSTLTEYLVNKGFKHISLLDIVREEQGMLSREELLDAADELRAEHGQSVLGERTLERLKGGDHVITSIEHPAEAEALMKHGELFLVEVRAAEDRRFRRVLERHREDDPKSKPGLIERDVDLHEVVKLADVVIGNEGTVKELYVKAGRMVADLRKRKVNRCVASPTVSPTASPEVHTGPADGHVRPSWDDYFMGIVKATSMRGTCDRGRTAVVIVKDKMILATGYVGSPMGLPHCDDVGHQMKSVIHEDGHESKHCVRTNHAEVNAIALAARKGIAIEGSTLYCKLEPCYTCAKMLINAGIKRVVCEKRYHAAQDTRKLFKDAGIILECLTEELEIYKNQ